MRRKRLSLNESQPSVALKLSVSTETITCWELNRNEPQIHYTPRIIEYLGYCPLYDIAGSTLSTRVKQFMFLDGFTQKECAKKLGIDTSTLDRIIKNKKHKIISTSC